jgi:uncharacterized membrane protein YdjX (TVP38/TMEM64 family)
MHRKTAVFATVAVIPLILAGYHFRLPIWEMGVHVYNMLSDREAVGSFILSWGMAAPIIFIGMQILQVIIAPIPGEASGFIGGFLFGAFNGFLYSSIGLAVGSLINFTIGRLMGKRFIRKLIPAAQIKQLDKLVHRQGAVILFILFLFPGFPKDYLCLFLGVSDISFKLFIIMASIGRMPGTLALSVQGASLYQQQYVLMAAVMLFCVIAAYLSYRYKERLYQWMDRFNGKSSS